MTDTLAEVKLEEDIAHDEAKLAALRAQAAADPPPAPAPQEVQASPNPPAGGGPAPHWPWGVNAHGPVIPRDMRPGPHNP